MFRQRNGGSTPPPGTQSPELPKPCAGERPGHQPGALELLRWSALCLALSLLVAAVAIPLLRWLGLWTAP